MKTTKTLGYTIQRLEREPQQQPTFNQIYELMVERAKIACKRTKDLFWSLMYNGRKYEAMYEDKHLANIRQAMKRKRNKVMYAQWGGSQSDINTQQVINDLRFGRL